MILQSVFVCVHVLLFMQMTHHRAQFLAVTCLPHTPRAHFHTDHPPPLVPSSELIILLYEREEAVVPGKKERRHFSRLKNVVVCYPSPLLPHPLTLSQEVGQRY